MWDEVSGAPDPVYAESDLSSVQRDAMLAFKETVMRNLVAQSAPKREVDYYSSNCVILIDTPQTGWLP